MCGIVGFIRRNGSLKDSGQILTRMLTMIHHRGPDESGFYLDDTAGIGNVRLSIIDLSTGQQPMCNQRGNLWIVFNGEIFNYLELKEELLSLGHRFKTASDTEVLLQLYEEFGADCLSRLNGQFVFAIWDNLRNELFIARDRVGIRPLYYTEDNGSFVFGSEIKAILEYPQISPRLNYISVSQLFTFWASLPGYSPFENILELEPGHYMIVKDQGITIKKYWELSFVSPNEYLTSSFNEAAEEFRGLLLDSVKLRLRSDVPVAAYLSGGLDSSAITYFVKQISPENLQTFSIGFADSNYDETKFQHDVSESLNTHHVSFKCTSTDIAEIFPSVIWHCESPVFRTAAAPMFLLSRKVGENNIKVVMTGEGADEILAGYDVFKEDKIRHFWSKYPNSKYRPLLLRRLYPYVPQISNMNTSMLKFVFGYKLEENNHPFYAFLLRWNNGSFIRSYFSESIKQQLNEYNPMDEIEKILPSGYNSWDSLSKAQWVETKLLMSNYLLSSQGDRMGMANSIEGRYPFLDYRLIEFVSKLPPSFKMKGLNEKYLLKKIMVGCLPESVLKRSKQAYRAPISSAFLSEKQPEYVKYFLSKEKIIEYDIFNYQMVEHLIQKFRKDKNISENDNIALTAIISTQLFYSMYIDRTFKPVPDIHLLQPRIIDKRIRK